MAMENKSPASRPAAKPATKREAALALICRADGATLAELIAATGWLPHSARAVISTLRKDGHAITRVKREGATCYAIKERG